MTGNIKRFGKKIVLLCLAAALLLSGCQKEGKVVKKISGDEKKGSEVKAAGRYVEKDIPLPEKENVNSIISLEKDWNGELILFTRDTSGPTVRFNAYTLKEGNKWEKKECKWLNDLKLTNNANNLKIVIGRDKKLYAFYRIYEDEETSVPTHVITTSDGKKAEKVKIPDIEKKIDMGGQGIYAYVDEIESLSNGNLVVCSFGKIAIYHRESGKLLLQLESEYSKIVTKDNMLYHYDTKAGSIDTYDGVSGKKLSSKPLKLKDTYEPILKITEDNTLVVYSREGIQQLKEGSDLWEVVVSDTTGTITSPRFYGRSFVPGLNEDYFVWYNSMDEKSKISCFYYDQDMPLEAENSITVYTLKDNSVIRQAASEFQAKNPNVNINVQVAMGDDTAAMEEDYIRTLNTELLAGKGPDVLILDGLPIESFINKGVLKDISSIILPMVSSGEYLPNIADAYTRDGKIYTVPTKIALPMAFGNQELTNMAGDLSKVAAFIGQNPDKKVFGIVEPSEMLSFYLDVLCNDLIQKDGSLDTEKLTSTLEQMKKIVDGSVLQDADKGLRKPTAFGIIEDGNLLYTENVEGFVQSQWSFSVVKQMKVSYNSVNNSFFPKGKIGINRAGNNQEIAEQFVREVLSEDAQITDYYDGFPVNKAVLEKFSTIERTQTGGYGGSVTGVDGKTYEYSGTWPIKANREGMIKMCETVTNEAGFDIKLKQIVLDKTTEYFKGKQSLEDTVGAISQASKAYLAE